MTARIRTSTVFGFAAMIFALAGCGSEEPVGGDAETVSPSQQAAVSSSTLREVTLNVTGMS